MSIDGHPRAGGRRPRWLRRPRRPGLPRATIPVRLQALAHHAAGGAADVLGQVPAVARRPHGLGRIARAEDEHPEERGGDEEHGPPAGVGAAPRQHGEEESDDGQDDVDHLVRRPGHGLPPGQRTVGQRGREEDGGAEHDGQQRLRSLHGLRDEPEADEVLGHLVDGEGQAPGGDRHGPQSARATGPAVDRPGPLQGRGAPSRGGRAHIIPMPPIPPMPPMPPPGMAGAPFFSGLSATRHSVVRTSAAMDAAFWSAPGSPWPGR